MSDTNSPPPSSSSSSTINIDSLTGYAPSPLQPLSESSLLSTLSEEDDDKNTTDNINDEYEEADGKYESKKNAFSKDDEKENTITKILEFVKESYIQILKESIQ